MQQQSIQYHLDAIRNILSMPPEKTVHERNKAMFTDIFTISKKVLNTDEQILPFKFIHIPIGLGLLISNAIAIVTATYMDKSGNNIPLPSLMLSIYSIYIGYMQKNTISPRQKEITSIFIVLSLVLCLLGTINENDLANTIPAYLYGITVIYMLYILITCEIEKNRRHQPIAISDIFIHHDPHQPDHNTKKAREHGGKLEWDPNDIIMLGHQSPVHPILKERNTTHADTRTILEQHLYHLSCQIPLIYITPSRNHIPHYINITANPSNTFKEKTIKKYFSYFLSRKKTNI